MTAKPVDHRMKRTQSSSTSGGPLVVSYRMALGDGAGHRRVELELPHDTTRLALARRLRAMAASLETP